VPIKLAPRYADGKLCLNTKKTNKPMMHKLEIQNACHDITGASSVDQQ